MNKHDQFVCDQLLRRAYAQWEKGKLRSAFRLFLSVVKRGGSDAQHMLAYCYDVGVGVKPNREAALLWYKKAYRRGDASSANNIGTIFRDENNFHEALKWFHRAVKKGDVDANLEIAKIYIAQHSDSKKISQHLRAVLNAKANVDVTEWSQVEANKLLKKLKDRKVGQKEISKRAT